jgi:hypothetical protein
VWWRKRTSAISLQPRAAEAALYWQRSLSIRVSNIAWSPVVLAACLSACGRIGYDAPDVGAGGGDPSLDASDHSLEDGGIGDAEPVEGTLSCAGIKNGDPSASDGVYMVDPDGPGGGAPLIAYCDMTTDGGGWTMVLSYVHRGGTNPAIVIRTDDLPLLAGDTLGADEAASESWGHASTSLIARFPFSQLRFSCRSSVHTRRLDFKTDLPSCLDYIRSGTGFCAGIASAFTGLAGHDARLPGGSTHVIGDAADLSMLERPFYKNSLPKADWVIAPDADEWECDDQARGSANDTIHRVWIR